MNWILTKNRLPNDGEWVLMYLRDYAGVDRYRAGMYHGGEWLSAANAFEGIGWLNNDHVIYWMPLPEAPVK